MKYLRTLAAMAATGVLAACGNGGGAVEPPVTQAPITSGSYATLQFAVGTANIAGQSGLNTVVTLRQSNGLSAFGYNTPVITWDGNFTNTAAAATSSKNVDIGTKQISGTALLAPGVANPASSFGAGTSSPEGIAWGGVNSTSWGAFGYGFNPSNSSTNGGPSSVIYPCLPRYTANVTAAGLSGGTPPCVNNGFIGAGAQYIGGPPAFPQIKGAALNGQEGAFTGFVPFAALTPAPNPATGTSVFNLSITVPSTVGTVSLSKSATMKSFTLLGTFATPVFTPNATGGGSFSYALPAGVTEAYLMLVNYGPAGDASVLSCNYGPGPYYYTVRVTAGSPNPIALGDNLGATPSVGSMPAGRSTKTLCSQADNKTANLAAGNTDPGSADQYQVYAVGFDYPAFAAAYPQSNGNAAPTITGANGQADVTLSDLSGVNVATPGLASTSQVRAVRHHAVRSQ